uniref:Uncharacterized protein n=1 Tax=Arion vulgaris TaxID=1028688 RepID=A0A0B6Z4D1_9EUPU
MESSDRKWLWNGQIFRKQLNNITIHILDWNPEGKRRVGKQKNYLVKNCGRGGQTDLGLMDGTL